jgi:hypothetical protein
MQDGFVGPMVYLPLGLPLSRKAVLPKRTPAVALIEAFILQLGQAFFAMQLK